MQRCPGARLSEGLGGARCRSAVSGGTRVFRQRAFPSAPLLGSAPLVAIILAAEVGLWPDPNPNPVGPGLLFFFAGVLATGCLAVGVVTVWLKLRRA